MGFPTKKKENSLGIQTTNQRSQGGQRRVGRSHPGRRRFQEEAGGGGAAPGAEGVKDQGKKGELGRGDLEEGRGGRRTKRQR